MLKNLVYCYVIAFLAYVSGNVNTGHAQPNQPLPAVIGEKTLSASGSPHEFFAEDGTGNGLITEITSGETYWVYVFGIDADGVTGSPGRKVRFNLEDQEEGSSLKSLGISFTLEHTGPNGNDRLECYQDFGFDGSSGQNLSYGTLLGTTFDLRFQFTREDPESEWQLTPYYRLAGGAWTLFFDDVLTGSESFDFLGAKLVVRLEAPPGGSVAGDISFDNFFVIGPPTEDPTSTFVDDDWTDLDPGDAVQFPGQSKIQIMGYDAFAVIQNGIDSLYLAVNGQAALEFNKFSGFNKPYSAQNTLNSIATICTVHVAAGTYIENLDIYYPLILDGAGSGEMGPDTTIIMSAKIDTPVVLIDGNQAKGFSASERLVIRDLRITSKDSTANGILITDGGNGAAFTNYITFYNVASVDNDSSGIAIRHMGTVKDIEITNCFLSNNGNNGFYISPVITSFDSLSMTGGQIHNNGIHGLTNIIDLFMLNGKGLKKSIGTLNSVLNGPTGITNIHITGTSFSGNGNEFTYGSGDISLFDFNGDASFTNVSIVGQGAQFGIQLHGNDSFDPCGIVSFDGVSITGTYEVQETASVKSIVLYQEPEPPMNGAGLFISGYSDLNGISFSNVHINVSSANLFTANNESTLNIGNTTLGGDAASDIVNFSPGDVDATSANFSTTNNFDIEDRVFHEMDLAILGLVTWVPENLYMTRNSSTNSDSSASIQRAINAATSGDTLNIAAGNFWNEPQILIEKNLIMIGSGKESTTIRADASTDGSGDGKGWFLVNEPAGLHVHDITFDGAGHQIHQAFRLNGQGSFTNVDFTEIQVDEGGPPDYDGIAIVAHGDGPVNVTNCTFTKIGRVGVRYTGSDVSGSVFSVNTYTGKGEGDSLDYAVDIQGGASIEVMDCTISDNRGSAGSDSSAGILVSTTGGAGTIANISGSEIFDCTSAIHVGAGSSDGSFVVATQNDLYDNANGVSTSSALFVKIEKSKIYQNTVGVDFNSVSVFFDIDNNDINNNVTGINITNSLGEIDNNTIHSNTANALTIFIDQQIDATTVNNNEFCSNGNLGIENQTPSIVVNATGNWWGASDGPGGEGPGSGDPVSEGVDYSSFKTSTLFPDSPCSEPVLLVETKIFLEGPYNSGSSEMTTALSTGGSLPLTSPYSEDPRSVTAIPQNVVDWVLVELRTSDTGPAVTSKSAFLHKDGRIVADDGTTGQISLPLAGGLLATVPNDIAARGNGYSLASSTPLPAVVFDTEKDRMEISKTGIAATINLGAGYFIVIKHRNHLAIMSTEAVALSGESSTLYDFTTAQIQAFGTDPMKELESGVFGMLAGDGNGDGGIDATDKNLVWRMQNGTVWTYTKLGDFNLDGGIDAMDSNLYWRSNNGTATQVPQ